MDKERRWQGIPRLTESPEREHSHTRELHTRGPVDIVEGLREKAPESKEKFWRQHCRKAAKEQMGKRPVPGKGAERMKELGLEVAERCRAYGVGQDAQLVLSVSVSIPHGICKESFTLLFTNCTYLLLSFLSTFGLGSFCSPCSVSDPSAFRFTYYLACFVLSTQEVFPFSHLYYPFCF